MPGWRRAEPPHASHQERPLSAHAIFVSDEPGSVASWTCEIFDETGTDRIGDVHEDDWDGAGRLHYRTNRRTANRHDYIRCKCNQFRRVTGSLGVSEAQTVVDVQTPRCRETPRPPAASSDHLICERGGPSTAVQTSGQLEPNRDLREVASHRPPRPLNPDYFRRTMCQQRGKERVHPQQEQGSSGVWRQSSQPTWLVIRIS